MSHDSSNTNMVAQTFAHPAAIDAYYFDHEATIVDIAEDMKLARHFTPSRQRQKFPFFFGASQIKSRAS